MIVGYAGTNWTGQQIQPYFDLETRALDDEIFVYPDVQWHDFPGWGNLGGWLLGPNAYPANGDADLVFTQQIVEHMKNNYCISPTQIFATGHSWGGDMAMVAACFLDTFRAAVPVAANRPYWFDTGNGSMTTCKGKTAMWAMFGQADDHFPQQSYPGQFGNEQRDFWLKEHSCQGVNSYTELNIGSTGYECVEYKGCTVNTRYCLYDKKYGHQKPDTYFSTEVMKYFRSFSLEVK